MLTYNLNIKYTINKIQGTDYRMIQMDISVDDGKFPIRSSLEFVKVTDGGFVAEAFDIYFTGNQKKMYCFFTTDAFSVFPGNVDISFGFTNEVIHTFETIPINAPSTIEVLPPIFSGIPHVDADNAWLASL